MIVNILIKIIVKRSDHAFRSNGCLMQWGSSFFSSHHRQRNYGLKLTS
jgi:hypothetical protein